MTDTLTLATPRIVAGPDALRALGTGSIVASVADLENAPWAARYRRQGTGFVRVDSDGNETRPGHVYTVGDFGTSEWYAHVDVPADAPADDRRAQGQALATMRRREADALAQLSGARAQVQSLLGDVSRLRDAVMHVERQRDRLEESRTELGLAKAVVAHFAERVASENGNMREFGILRDAGVMPEPFDFSEESAMRDWLVTVSEAANDAEMCEVFDRLCQRLGLPDREDLGLKSKDYTVRGTVTITVPVSYTINARNEDDAIERVDDIVSAEDALVNDYAGLRDLIRNGDATLEWDEAEEI